MNKILGLLAIVIVSSSSLPVSWACGGGKEGNDPECADRKGLQYTRGKRKAKDQGASESPEKKGRSKCPLEQALATRITKSLDSSPFCIEKKQLDFVIADVINACKISNRSET